MNVLNVCDCREPVLSVSVHPSGKLALSVSQNKMRTWNLLTGKCAYVTSIKSMTTSTVVYFIVPAATGYIGTMDLHSYGVYGKVKYSMIFLKVKSYS